MIKHEHDQSSGAFHEHISARMGSFHEFAKQFLCRILSHPLSPCRATQSKTKMDKKPGSSHFTLRTAASDKLIFSPNLLAMASNI